VLPSTKLTSSESVGPEFIKTEDEPLARRCDDLGNVFVRDRRGKATVLIRSIRARSGEGERGAVIVEFAILLPLLLLITFGIVEYSSAYHDASLTADATRAGGRVGSAMATNASYSSSIVDAVNSALSTLPSDAPQELWIYKANANGYPGTGTSFSNCATNCIRYTWNSAAKAFDASKPSGGGWPASSQQVCNQPFDELGVYLKINHDFVTKFFGPSLTITDHSVFRLEPVPSSLCAT
jgi:hypothetical protein